jgi:DNA-binding transcriptional MerR regulator
VAVYSIVDLEKLTGVKAHTIRIWEQRYGVISPKRTQSNIRYYQEDDLKQLLNISILNKNGHKISRIAQMDPEEITETAAVLSSVDGSFAAHLDALTIAMIEMDEIKFDKIISTHIHQIGIERTMMEFIYPFLDKLNILWLTGSINPVQENFISFLIRQKIVSATDQLSSAPEVHAKKCMLYLPEGEKQELSLLFIQYMLRVRNYRVIYLGQDISVADLKVAAEIYQPQYICTMINSSFEKESIQEYVNNLSNEIFNCHILLSGYQVHAQNFEHGKNIHKVQSLDQLIQIITAGERNTH